MPLESFDCRSNAARMQSERPIGPRRMSPDVIQYTAESHIQEYTKNFHSDGIPAHFASGVARFEIPSQMWREFWNFFIPAASAWIRRIPNKCDGAFIVDIMTFD